ncbi:MAG: LuxR C-terminal-related transcriptional regulator, partial [Oscillospiraceae bacterium]
EVVAQTRLDLYRYLDTAFYEQWDSEVKRAMLPLAAFDSFTLRMAELVTGDQNPQRLIEKAMAVSEFLQTDGNGNYQIRSILREYLCYKQQTDLTKAQRDNIYHSAGLYYELNNDIEKALECYEKTGNQDKIAELLIRNAGKHVGIGHYYETRNYYFALPEEQVKQSPALMAGMSLLCSLLMQTEESEQWYHALVEYEQQPDLSNNQRKEAKSRIAYLDIGLPHRGNVKISELLKNMAVLCTSRKLDLPEFSVTSNLPSVMNGGKDFCEWSKTDRDLAKMLKKPAEIVLGSFGVGLANIALAESSFEKNSLDPYEIMTLLNSGYSLADAKGKPEMCFAAAGIMARVHIGRKQPQVAYDFIADLGEKFRRNGQTHLLPNLNAFLVWIHLLRGDMTKVEEWLENEAPNENMDFYILERYRYLVKVKAYLATGQPEKAMSLIERLELYFEAHRRTYNKIENGLLRAIVQYRMKLGDWQKSLETALQTAQEYGFIRVVAEYGTAILPLMKEAGDLALTPKYQSAVLAATGETAVFYPEYLKPTQTTEEPLTDTEQKVLELLCTGKPLEEIAKLCGISYNTVKYHNRNIYRKLGVKSRQQVQTQAKKLGLYGGSI